MILGSDYWDSHESIQVSPLRHIVPLPRDARRQQYLHVSASELITGYDSKGSPSDDSYDVLQAILHDISAHAHAHASLTPSHPRIHLLLFSIVFQETALLSKMSQQRGTDRSPASMFPLLFLAVSCVIKP